MYVVITSMMESYADGSIFSLSTVSLLIFFLENASQRKMERLVSKKRKKSERKFFFRPARCDPIFFAPIS